MMITSTKVISNLDLDLFDKSLNAGIEKLSSNTKYEIVDIRVSTNEVCNRTRYTALVIFKRKI